MSAEILPPLYALVAYIHGALGQFVEDLRAEVHPAHAHLAAHVSILPPRPMIGSEQQAHDMLLRRCSDVEPFEIEFGEVESFIPTTPTVFIRVAHKGYRMRELHDSLNAEGLSYTEPLVYMPHLTIAKLANMERAREVFDLAADRWHNYQGPRKARIEGVTFVKGRDCNWTDIEEISLAAVRK
jgi:2'-5' RNA ligase superfamily